MTQELKTPPIITPDPKQCSICKERFAEPWMAERCQAQGRPPIEYHAGDVLWTGRRNSNLVVVTRAQVHHGIGVKCNVEGPCPHDVTYHGHQLVPNTFGSERAFICPGWDWKKVSPGHERVTTLNDAMWGIIPESGPPEVYLIPVDLQVEWEKLWSYYPDPEKSGRRGGRRML